MTQTMAPRRDGVQVLSRAAELLRCLASEPDGLTLVDLASRVQLPRSTAHRIIGALAQEGFVATAPSGKLRVGPALVGIAVASRRDIRHEAAPYLERLSRELRETVDLAVLDGNEVQFIDQFVFRRYLRIGSEIGGRFPVHCTANGKALLATLPDAEIVRRLPVTLERLTDHTMTDRQQLLTEIADARSTGLGFDREEHAAGVAAAACIIRDAVGNAAAVTVVAPAARFYGHEERITEALIRTRDEIQMVLKGA